MNYVIFDFRADFLGSTFSSLETASHLAIVIFGSHDRFRRHHPPHISSPPCCRHELSSSGRSGKVRTKLCSLRLRLVQQCLANASPLLPGPHIVPYDSPPSLPDHDSDRHEVLTAGSSPSTVSPSPRSRRASTRPRSAPRHAPPPSCPTSSASSSRFTTARSTTT